MTENFEITRTIKKGCTYQPNAILRDKNLTSDAVRVIYFLLSTTKGFHLNTRGIAKTLGLSESKVKRAISLLESTGYIRIERVKTRKLFEGYKWLIADVSGFYRKSTDGLTMNDTTMHGLTMDDTTVHDTTMGAPTYELQIDELPINEKTNKELPIDESSSTPTPSPKEEGDEVNENLPLNGSSFSVYPSSGKNSSSAEPISHKEYLYQQFLKKYPRKPTRAAATKQAFFDIPDLEDIFAEIMAGLDAWCNSEQWNKNGGQYITNPFNFITLQKWEEIPRGINTEIDPGLAKFLNVPMEVYL